MTKPSNESFPGRRIFPVRERIFKEIGARRGADSVHLMRAESGRSVSNTVRELGRGVCIGRVFHPLTMERDRNTVPNIGVKY
jgi:hypothetical protein